VLERFRRSLRFRLSLSGALAIFLFAAGTGFYLYATVKATLGQSIQRDVEETARVLQHKVVVDGDPVDQELLDVGDHLSVRFYSPEGKVVLESPNLAWLAPASAYPPAGQDRSLMGERPGEGHRLKVLTVPYPGGWYQVVRNCDTEAYLLRRIRLALAAVLTLMPFLGFSAGMLAVQRGLKPLDTLAAHAAAIRPENLGSRLDLAGFPLELEPLAEAINSTLDRLEAAFAKLSGLNADLAHELRSPLHAHRLELESILQRPDLQPDLADRLGGWMEDVDHLIAVIEQMLFLAQAEDPTVVLQQEPIPAEAMLQAVLRPFAAWAEDREIRLSIAAGAGGTFPGDPTLVRQALHNLVANAIRHSPEGGTITVAFSLASGHPVFTVEDQGPGLPLDLLPQVGRRFLKGGSGTGLGLAIASRIAELHGGRLSIENLVPAGARVHLALG